MALADSVPGVSGGTIAFLLGFYDSFINSLNDIMGRDNAKRKKAFFFLIKLGVGWVIGMLLAVSVLANVFESGIYKVSSLFLGFIILAIPVMIMEEKESIKGKYYNIIWAVIGVAIVVGISLINPSGSGADVSHMNIGTVIFVVLAGMCAISAMVLPGISGSTILLTFGLYMPVITGIKEFLHLNFASLLKYGGLLSSTDSERLGTAADCAELSLKISSQGFHKSCSVDFPPRSGRAFSSSSISLVLCALSPMPSMALKVHCEISGEYMTAGGSGDSTI